MMPWCESNLARQRELKDVNGINLQDSKVREKNGRGVEVAEV